MNGYLLGGTRVGFEPVIGERHLSSIVLIAVPGGLFRDALEQTLGVPQNLRGDAITFIASRLLR